MSRKARILFSSRDPGSAGHIAALAETFRNHGGFDVGLAASGAALRMLQRAGESPRAFASSNGCDHVKVGEDPSFLLEMARRILRLDHPDAVFVGLSSFGVGIDEALLATAQVPTFAMQDFWGDVNLGLGVPAGIYFVLDEDAVALTRQRWGVHAVAVGSPKHARYAALDIVGLRRTGRGAIGVGEDTKVVGFFGQSPEIPGHEETYEDLVKAIANVTPRPLVLLREHPKFATRRREHMCFAERQGLRVADVTNEEGHETWLASCDVVTTAFSASGLDHAYLSAHSRQPIGMVLYLMFNAELRHFAERVCGMKQFPIVKRGIGQVVERAPEIPPSLERALWPESATAYFRASKSLGGQDPAPRIIQTVLQILSYRTGTLHHG